MNDSRNVLRSWLLNRYYQSLKANCHSIELTNLNHSALIISPHQDDETLGCGGTIIRKVAAGANVRIVFMTDGSQSHRHLMPAETLVDLRRSEAIAACNVLGISEENISFLNFPDGNLGAYKAEATEQLLELLTRFQPDEVFVPYRREPTADHQSTYEIASAALVKYHQPVTVYEYPVWFWHHWPWISMRQPDLRDSAVVLKHTVQARAGKRLIDTFRHRVSIVDVRQQKIEALQQHRSQMTPLMADVNWLTLYDVANGEFLNCLLQDFELFHRSDHAPTG